MDKGVLFTFGDGTLAVDSILVGGGGRWGGGGCVRSEVTDISWTGEGGVPCLPFDWVGLDLGLRPLLVNE